MPRRVDHEERRDQIVQAVWRLTERGGLGAATFREVAAEAGVSVRLVQYYFGSKAELLAEANRRALDLMAGRILGRFASFGDSALPRDVVAGVLREFLPTDEQSRRAMVLYYAFYTAQMTDPAVRGVGGVPRRLVTLIAAQIRRAQADGAAHADLDPELEGTLLTAVVAALASGVLAGYSTLAESSAALDYAIDRMFRPGPASGRGTMPGGAIGGDRAGPDARRGRGSGPARRR
jgi:TetR/AcrR family transcriptional repressor of bet genes